MSATSDIKKFTPGHCQYCYCDLHENEFYSNENFYSAHKNECPLAKFCYDCGVRADRITSKHRWDCDNLCCGNHVTRPGNQRSTKHTKECLVGNLLKQEFKSSCEGCGAMNPFSHHKYCDKTSHHDKEQQCDFWFEIEHITGKLIVEEYPVNIGYSVQIRSRLYPHFEVDIDTDSRQIYCRYQCSPSRQKTISFPKNEPKTFRHWFVNEFAEYCQSCLPKPEERFDTIFDQDFHEKIKALTCDSPNLDIIAKHNHFVVFDTDKNADVLRCVESCNLAGRPDLAFVYVCDDLPVQFTSNDRAQLKEKVLDYIVNNHPRIILKK